MNFLTQPLYANGEPIWPGDWLRVYVPSLGIWHHGIVRGLPYLTAGLFVADIAHNMKLTGITKTDLTRYAEGQPVFLYRRPFEAQVAGIFARVDRSMGKPYHLFNQNCEHFASFAFTGKAESTSVKAVGALVLVGVVAGLLNS
jgi:hypothetical protein